MDSSIEIVECSQHHFATGVTRTNDRSVAKLNRKAMMIAENEPDLQAAMAADFKTTTCCRIQLIDDCAVL